MPHALPHIASTKRLRRDHQLKQRRLQQKDSSVSIVEGTRIGISAQSSRGGGVTTQQSASRSVAGEVEEKTTRAPEEVHSHFLADEFPPEELDLAAFPKDNGATITRMALLCAALFISSCKIRVLSPITTNG